MTEDQNLKQSIIRYRVDFYDAFDGWIYRGLPIGSVPNNEYTKLEVAKTTCKKLMDKLGPFGMDEHYGVIDLVTGIEVFCGKNYHTSAPKTKEEKGNEES